MQQGVSGLISSDGLLGMAKSAVKRSVLAYYSVITPAKHPRNMLFILSHMRAGSSLLSHLLLSNPEIMGYGETHIEYESKADFRKLYYDVMLKRRRLFPKNAKYILDKILHNSHFPEDDIEFLCVPNLRVVFLLRDPEGTLGSFARSWGVGPEETVGYYRNRLARLEEYAETFAGRVPFALVTYSELLTDTPSALSSLGRFLELRQPLSEDYELLRTTGVKGIGDHSPNIQAGRIVRKRHTPGDVHLSDDILRDGQAAYDQCQQAIRQLCDTANPV